MNVNDEHKKIVNVNNKRKRDEEFEKILYRAMEILKKQCQSDTLSTNRLIRRKYKTKKYGFE